MKDAPGATPVPPSSSMGADRRKSSTGGSSGGAHVPFSSFSTPSTSGATAAPPTPVSGRSSTNNNGDHSTGARTKRNQKDLAADHIKALKTIADALAHSQADDEDEDIMWGTMMGRKMKRVYNDELKEEVVTHVTDVISKAVLNKRHSALGPGEEATASNAATVQVDNFPIQPIYVHQQNETAHMITAPLALPQQAQQGPVPVPVQQKFQQTIHHQQVLTHTSTPPRSLLGYTPSTNEFPYNMTQTPPRPHASQVYVAAGTSNYDLMPL